MLSSNEAIATEHSGSIYILLQDGFSELVTCVPEVAVRDEEGLLDIAVVCDLARPKRFFHFL